ncbi:hypothetical protein BKA66DRAFT_55203 [Pyrenochaeta sp. MPI-SDFR-AT-0127]|nr:hypothetical protein BKA66DRAFT_55203 [Pyrenochaeta sp. MPI-SDFR-AT-0127]
MANIVEDLHVHTEIENTSVAYFFCRHDLPESLKARTVIGALVRQLRRSMSRLLLWTFAS